MDTRLAEATEKQNALLKKGLENGLGLNAVEVQNALGLKDLNRSHFAECIDIAIAGMNVTSIRLQQKLISTGQRWDRVTARIEAIGDEMTDERVFWVEEEEKLATEYLGICDRITNITGKAFQGSKELAIIKWKLANNGGGTKKKPDKPGFKPIDVDLQ